MSTRDAQLKPPTRNGKAIALCLMLGSAVVMGLILKSFAIERAKRHAYNECCRKYRDLRVVKDVDMTDPLVRTIPDFLTKSECSRLIQIAEDSGFTRSTVVGGPSKISSDRTSRSVYLDKGANPFISSIEERASKLFGLPVENIESLQVVKYAFGDQFKEHYDYFEKGSPSTDEALTRGGQRVATIFVYLNTLHGPFLNIMRDGRVTPGDDPDVASGCTAFPKLGFQVQPLVGKALLFQNVTEDGKEDPRMLHAGTAVGMYDIKYGLNIWVRQNAWNNN